MKHSEFMSSIKSYYGKYENAFIEDVILKFALTIPESELENAFNKILSNIPRKENQNAVDIARLKKLFAESETNLESEASRWFDMLTRTGNSLDHVIISDVRAQEAVQSFGGWPAFCQRKPEDEHWHRKNFIAAYMKAVPGENVPQMLFGESTRRDKTPLMFGDRDLCAAALEYHKGEAMNLITDMTRGMKANVSKA